MRAAHNARGHSTHSFNVFRASACLTELIAPQASRLVLRCVMVGQDLLVFGSRTDQCYTSLPVISAEHSHDFAVAVVDRAAGEAILSVDSKGPVLMTAEGIRPVEAAPANHLIVTRLCDEKELRSLRWRGRKSGFGSLFQWRAHAEKRQVRGLIYLDDSRLTTIDVSLDVELVRRIESEFLLLCPAYLSGNDVVVSHH